VSKNKVWTQTVNRFSIIIVYRYPSPSLEFFEFSRSDSIVVSSLTSFANAFSTCSFSSVKSLFSSSFSQCKNSHTLTMKNFGSESPFGFRVGFGFGFGFGLTHRNRNRRIGCWLFLKLLQNQLPSNQIPLGIILVGQTQVKQHILIDLFSVYCPGNFRGLF
jgi:hypothetical protein